MRLQDWLLLGILLGVSAWVISAAVNLRRRMEGHR